MGEGQMSVVLSALKNSPACMDSAQREQQEALRLDPQGLIHSYLNTPHQSASMASLSWSFCGLVSGWGLLW